MWDNINYLNDAVKMSKKKEEKLSFTHELVTNAEQASINCLK